MARLSRTATCFASELLSKFRDTLDREGWSGSEELIQEEGYPGKKGYLSARDIENTVAVFSLPGKGEEKSRPPLFAYASHPCVHPQHGSLMARLDK